MPRKTKKQLAKEAAQVEEAIQALVMSCRERLMTYFKGDCVTQFTDSSIWLDNVRFRSNEVNTGGSAQSYQYLRREHEISDPKKLLFGDIPFAVMHKEPDVISFHKYVMNRSPEFSVIYDQLREFFGKYLPGVELEENDDLEELNDGRRDRTMLLNSFRNSLMTFDELVERAKGRRGMEPVEITPEQAQRMDQARYIERLNEMAAQFGSGFTTYSPSDVQWTRAPRPTIHVSEDADDLVYGRHVWDDDDL